jgi:O-glycosyl hydrolase
MAASHESGDVMRAQVLFGLATLIAVAAGACGSSKNAASSGDTGAVGGAGNASGSAALIGGTSAGGAGQIGGATASAGTATTGAGGSGAAGAGSSNAAGGSGGQAVVVTNPNANIKLTQQAQVIDGFGVSTSWLSAPDASIRTSVYDALFSVTKGAGLSLIRNRIPFRENPNNGLDDKFINKNADGTYQTTTNADGSKTFSLNWDNWDLDGTQTMISAVKAAGADYQVTRFMSTPWTPPNNATSKWKVSDAQHTIDYAMAPEVGGALDPSHYADYADVLADYALGYKAKMGVDLTLLSLQNEPNFQCSYESADWSADQLHAFLVTLSTEFTKKGVFTQLPNLHIIAPEFQNVADTLVAPILADSATSALMGAVGVHQYEFGTNNQDSYAPDLLSASLTAGKHLWMTEWSTAAWANDTSITDALILAKLVHQDFTVGSFSAFNYWWAWSTGNSALVVINGTTVTVPKRLYALGNFSRFVRSGWHRVTTTAGPAANIYLSAFEAAAGDQVAIVAINTGTSVATLPLTVDAGTLGTLTQYRTSATENLAKVGTLPGGASVRATLAPASVTTFVAAIQP